MIKAHIRYRTRRRALAIRMRGTIIRITRVTLPETFGGGGGGGAINELCVAKKFRTQRIEGQIDV